jgi:hypothetical protein
MAMPSFPVTISEMAKMREDGDIISLSFSWICVGCTAVFLISEAVYYASRDLIFMWSGVGFFAFAVMCALVVCLYRPIFLTEERRKKEGLDRIRRKKYEALDKLNGIDLEEEMAKLTPEEMDGYLSYSPKKFPMTQLLSVVQIRRKKYHR